MKPREIKNRISLAGAVHWDARLFDSLIPLPDGTSYNSYLIQGSEKTALVDSVDPKMKDILLTQLRDVDKLDYIIQQHAEQDHSGSIPYVLEKHPEAQVLCSSKCKSMLVDYLCIDEGKIRTVEDGEELSLGDKTLKFIYTPWVHWPETMSTYAVEDRVLFSCDFFGSHLATSEIFVKDKGHVYEAAKRYYAEIMMPFRKVVKNNVKKIEQYDIDIICPSHGPSYNEPAFIINAYKDWVSDQPENLVVIPFVSMHGSTLKMVDYLVSALAERGVSVKRFDLAATDIGKLAISLVDAATIIIGTPTVHVGPHPAVFYASHLANALRPKVKYASIIGSYGWSSKAIERIAELIPNLQVELLDTVLCRGYPRAGDFSALESLADAVAQKHKSEGLEDRKGVC